MHFSAENKGQSCRSVYTRPVSQIRHRASDFYDRLRDNKKLIVAERRDLQKYSDWRQLWYPNFEDFSRAEAMAGAENNTITNVTVQLGATAYLHCHVRSTGDRALAGAEQVSWVRRRDWHILSSGLFTYTNDERFQILHAEGSDDWTLQIKFVQKRDNGTYECQVSTNAGLISHFVNLQIVVPEATIQGTRSGEHHVDVGSVIDLVCVIEKPEPLPGAAPGLIEKIEKIKRYQTGFCSLL
ncbi:hypothetical protein TcasGA2_TC010603 [Tribolium castaneum]|uniref:Ig-like domain-containing protein n=1 Tax=Tribolium castaneum TaxID=7070 RepID=A0A139WFX3_TRICA|nr:hypothetical protein TcasGA2_TC010603 [Tribolium castaneum]